MTNSLHNLSSSSSSSSSIQGALPFASEIPTAPLAVHPFLQFAERLRRHDFRVVSDQTQNFIHAVGLLGPRHMRDVYHASIATLAPPIERRAEFDALFRLQFLGQSVQAATASTDDDDELQAFDERDGSMEVLEADEINEAGEQATGAESLSVRQFDTMDESTSLRWLRRHGARYLPRRRTLRWQQSHRGKRWDLRRSLRDAVKRDGEILKIPHMRRRVHQRRIVLLIDISGSMKQHTDSYLRFAHTLAGVSERLEVFTLGTRLTRVSRAIRLPDQGQALQQAGLQVSDWDGGTRLGDALQAYLDIPRFAGFARGSMVLVLSDGLERGDHSAMTTAVHKLSRLCWHLSWLTPLAADIHSGDSSSGQARNAFYPQTQALQSILPFIDVIDNGATVSDLCRHLVMLRGDSRLDTGAGSKPF